MPSQFLVEFASPSPLAVVWADTTDFSVTGVTRTHQIDLTSLASGSARGGAKADLGANPGDEYAVEIAVEFASAPTAGGQVQVGLSWSDNSTAGTLNSGGHSGTDAAFTLGTSNTLFSQLDFIGTMSVNAAGAGTVQRSALGMIRPVTRYVSPVVWNSASTAFDTDAITMYLRLIPRVVEAQ